ncbi:MAG: hypothetical protein DRJ97_02490 [Thermoprotei archaeon]|nr:MAG: hypothetical protein DRJ97_02490 [Thermoprotei archaeon]
MVPSVKRPGTVKAIYLTRWSLFAALCVAGSFIPFPSPVGTIAFDSFPGYFAALYFGPLDGIVVCFIGHMVTSIVHGFPLGPWHFVIAVGMAAVGAATGIINKALSKPWGFIPATAAGAAINTALFITAIPVLGWLGSLLLVPFLAAASLLNGALAAAVYVAVRGKRLI